TDEVAPRVLGVTSTNLNNEQKAPTKNNIKLATRLGGKILLQVQNRGEAWYVNPVSLKKYYLPINNTSLDIIKKLTYKLKNLI
ncbi:MAG: hypothetical protein AAB657_00390, partial [Patescibacteria group bacterium]